MVHILPLRLLRKRFRTAFDGVALPKQPADPAQLLMMKQDCRWIWLISF
jgi:hypothetical protein